MAPKQPNRGTQKWEALQWLQTGPLCQSAVYAPNSGVTHRLGARIYDLRMDGWPIMSRRCEDHRHNHSAGMVEYILEETS